MKSITLASSTFFIYTLTSCTHITLLGHKSAYDVNAEFSGDPIAPVSMNAGFEGRSFAAVPPKEAVSLWENLIPKRLPEGDVMSTILELKIEKVQPQGVQGALDNVPFDYVTSGATGLAADAAAGSNPTGTTLELNQVSTSVEVTEAKKISEQIQTITKDGAKTFNQ
jgi:hypothetical protein